MYAATHPQYTQIINRNLLRHTHTSYKKRQTSRSKISFRHKDDKKRPEADTTEAFKPLILSFFYLTSQPALGLTQPFSGGASPAFQQWSVSSTSPSL